jgi:hypothetical protein
MEHRHIHAGPYDSVAAIRSVLERGDYGDIQGLYGAVWRAPNGCVAERALRAAEARDLGAPAVTLRRLIAARRASVHDKQ